MSAEVNQKFSGRCTGRNSSRRSLPFWRSNHQVLLTYDPTIHHPDPPCLPVLPFHHAQDALHRRHVGSVAIESLIAERKSFPVHNQCDHHLFAVRAMIARVAPAHHGVLFCRPFHNTCWSSHTTAHRTRLRITPRSAASDAVPVWSCAAESGPDSDTGECR